MALIACWEPDEAVGKQCALARSTHVETEDGAEVVLHRHACADKPPVLLVHGISSNARFWDLDPEHSLADWLADRGHDVWLLDLRGHGEALWRADGSRQISGWTVDDYGRYDVAAAVDHVRAVTGYRTVGYVGHSMGGMVGAIYTVTRGAEKLSSLVAVGSPIAFSMDDPLLPLARAGFAAGGAMLFWFETPLAGSFAADVGDVIPTSLVARLYNPENVSATVADRLMRNIVSPNSREEMQHFSRMLRDERFQSFDGSVDYTAELAKVKVPTLAVVGAADQIAWPHSVERWKTAVGGEVELLYAGKSGGLSTDYGHLDMGLGEKAADEIFPRIADWLDHHPAKR
jgi:oxygen-independent coproporphyrinogen-3 oxidase